MSPALTPEFALIARHFTRPAAGAGVALGVGDDCALVQPGAGMTLAITTDTLVAGRHFFADVDPASLGHKALAVNLSDLAAMGATPRWVTLAITLPGIDDAWLAAFADGFFALATDAHVALIGGDTTGGPLAITVTALGEVRAESALRRDGASPGDDVWVSGELGDAALAVAHRYGRVPLADDARGQVSERLDWPQPRVALGRALGGVASAALDISDGLLADLGHICERSQVGAVVEEAVVPRSRWVAAFGAAALPWVLAGGDDYELCFTANPVARERVGQIAQALALPLTRIGRIVAGQGVTVQGADGAPLTLPHSGFDHFAATPADSTHGAS